MGIDGALPRVPAVYEEKTRWRLDDDVGPGDRQNDNYESIRGHLDKVRDLFEEEAALGWMVDMDEAEARKIYGSKLHIASLSVVEEKDKIRVVHDASHGVHVNHRIRVRDQVRCPWGRRGQAAFPGEAGLQGEGVHGARGRRQGPPENQGPGGGLGLPGLPDQEWAGLA